MEYKIQEEKIITPKNFRKDEQTRYKEKDDQIIKVRKIPFCDSFFPNLKAGLKNIGIWAIILTVLVFVGIKIYNFTTRLSEEELLINSIMADLKSMPENPSYQELIDFRDDVFRGLSDYIGVKTQYDSKGNCSGFGCQYKEAMINLYDKLKINNNEPL